jgi:photosynthetic reaction center cytochrome c subunit
MRISGWVYAGAAAAVLLGGLMVATAGWSLPPAKSQQIGFRGVGMMQSKDASVVAAQAKITAPPPAYEASAEGPRAKEVYPNLKVLGDLSEDQFNRLMASFAEWVGGEQSCAYCHVETDFASDEKYTKVVARRMLQMTRRINSTWTAHVAQTGVTCYTCHRGQPLPAERWFTPMAPDLHSNFIGGNRDQNAPETTAGLASLPGGAFAKYLVSESTSKNIRVAGTTALRTDHTASIQDTESTYSLMIHMSKSLGVNCTYCHNSRAFADWSQSSPQRGTAWYGIRMVRDLNTNFIEPLGGTFPAIPEGRLGPLKDAAKVNCATCHRGAYKPLYGAAMAEHYPALYEPSRVKAEATDVPLSQADSSAAAALVN